MIKKRKTDFWWVLGFIALIIFIKVSVVGFYLVPSASMEPGILPGDRILVNKLKYGFTPPFFKTQLFSWGEIKRGDVVVFEDNNRRKFVKRVIGVSGDVIVFKDGHIYVNNNELDLQNTGKQFLLNENLPVTLLTEKSEKIGLPLHSIYMSENMQTTFFENGRFYVDEGSLFVLGDNRDFS